MTRHRGTRHCVDQLSHRDEPRGDPSQALVHSNPSGKFTVSLSSIDLGQGMKSVDPADLRRDARRAGRG